MKITGIEIGEYRQFKNIKFDFTYPKGHPKEGQPLEKVCFIGQSGTGKTTLLNLIWELENALIHAMSSLFDTSSFNSLSDNFLPESIERTIFSFNIDGQQILFDRFSEIGKSDKDFLSNWFLEKRTKTQQYKINDTNKICLYIKDSIAREADAFLVDQKGTPQSIFGGLVKTDTQVENDKRDKENLISEAGRKKTISLGDSQSLPTWEYVLRDISQYDETGRELVMGIVSDREKITADQLIKRLVHWRDNTPNPRIDLAKRCLNPLLNHFFLEMDTESTEVPIKIKTKKGITLDSTFISSGTRQLLATAIPIYKFDTKDTVILFDEPERSLFPDIQRELIKYYTSLAPEAQFFFATHSPIIASAFEPCERFILYFDENGEVNYHTGVAPEGDDPNDILRQDFAMAELMLQKGLEEYERYRQLAMQIRAETDEEKKNQLIVERLELGNRYNFAGQYAQSK
ncbi:hypothetical protein GCM10028808_72260 [Spirosoma migulaei]